jgi:hypothetical protein
MDPRILAMEGRLEAESAIATPGGYVLPDLEATLAEIGASYPLLGYPAQVDEEIDEQAALDAVIFAGILTP